MNEQQIVAWLGLAHCLILLTFMVAMIIRDWRRGQ